MNVEQAKRHEISHRPEFQELRRAQRRSGVRMTVVATGGFLLYVLLSSFAPELMNTSLHGHLTLGLALGLGQFVVMALIARRHIVHMRTHVDPIARGFRTQAHRQHPDRQSRPGQAPASHHTQGYRTW
ncbi:hypothetical protein GCM10022403_077450 [Streptomyces coacervatus]|uniref:DUF485 domain-containing protein n=1 Tax=Streptomyces coacervatus TaxID=647381 RepID=A0ABP7J278_9ACTN|nr:DUF485 domain-containing protein [Streptomyces coacervatus]MDF2272737.1 DUF485 domain-containing protein [Streptomyces coacervatus]